ncbi:hypothetical protein [Auritidibacter ignavus]|uniref:hypothetical protein n=1 Tax=Auritidibacter ignavus TaxID=678932 RepID=UPI000F03F086|nr:hypothetical protein [Auritidibacter ignavus]NIH71688.1 SdpC family antimicrobial peptide [Auritidibacter ignavus]RMX21443.1 hypothetical protein DYI20_11900 [Auritidibacter ignavus]
MSFSKRVTATGITAALLFAGGIAPGYASQGNLSVPQDEISDSASLQELKYSDQEVMQLLLAGQGKMAEENPDLIAYLGFNEETPHTNEENLNEIIADYLAYEPNFVDNVRTPLASGEPHEVEEALVYLSNSFAEYLETLEADMPDAETQGICDGGAEICTTAYAIAVVNGLVYANVAGATAAVATLAVTWVYLMDPEGDSTQLERDLLTVKMIEALEK